ncbi:MAG: hypothetical protein H0W73_19800, partial [Bacteroidetes bacterium]|nr:hypothetical protein [Bacteroidota bacterium]
PLDMILDVMELILKEKLKHQIIAINQNRSLLILALLYDKGSAHHKTLMVNINQMLENYNDFRFSQLEEGKDWRGKQL